MSSYGEKNGRVELERRLAQTFTSTLTITMSITMKLCFFIHHDFNINLSEL